MDDRLTVVEVEGRDELKNVAASLGEGLSETPAQGLDRVVVLAVDVESDPLRGRVLLRQVHRPQTAQL